MATYEDRWFEVWFSDGSDLCPTWLLIVTPYLSKPGSFVVYDPQEQNRIVYQGKDYDTVTSWLAEDEYSVVEGRMFSDDGWPQR